MIGLFSNKNPLVTCAEVRNKQVTGPGLISVLFTLEQLSCNVETPDGGSLIGDTDGQLLDWQIAVIVVACIVAAGAAILTGILVRKHQLAKETQALN